MADESIPSLSQGWVVVAAALLVAPLVLPSAVRRVQSFLPHEDMRWAPRLVYGGWALFVAGVASAYFAGLPARLVLAAGLMPQIPLAMVFLCKAGTLKSSEMLAGWRYPVIGAFVVSAFAAPSIDPITQTLVAVPMIVLYFLGIVLSKLVESNPLIPPGGAFGS